MLENDQLVFNRYLSNEGIEIMTCILKNNVWASTVAICHAIDEISDCIECPKADDMKGFIDLKVRNILVQVQDLDRFILLLSELYYWKFFLQPIMLTFSVSIAAFFYLYVDWTSGLGTAFLTYSQLYILCDIGNEVVTAVMCTHYYLKSTHLPNNSFDFV
ncbi:uncharacterized protein LOC129567422 [Sitodiplosis mosellana]|uniref:uncharacterized protein LOC129567422 n=1 Tax=Sitodiplosis mosellana TaxID=263140 RepID=UPI002443C743|nr:uncharacterized protein LOC129567422 [Sitodiplosis mosellana]